MTEFVGQQDAFMQGLKADSQDKKKLADHHFREGYLTALSHVRNSVLSIEKEAKNFYRSGGYFGYLEAVSNIYAEIDELMKKVLGNKNAR